MSEFKAFSKNSFYVVIGIYVIFILSNLFFKGTLNQGGYVVVYASLILHFPLTIAFLLIFIYDVIRGRPLFKDLRKEVLLLIIALILLGILYISLSYCTNCEF